MPDGVVENAVAEEGSASALVNLDGAGGEGKSATDENKDIVADVEGQGKVPTVSEIDLDGSKVEVPDAVAKHIEDLKANAKTDAPESYDLILPDEFKGQIEADANDPRWIALQEVAKAKNLSQEQVNGILAMHYGQEAAGVTSDAEFGANQKAKLIEAFNDGGNLTDDQATQSAQGVADWAVGLLKPDIAKNPGLVTELKSLAMTATGVQLLAALKARTGETSIPGSRDVGVGSAGKSLAERLYPTMTNDPHR